MTTEPKASGLTSVLNDMNAANSNNSHQEFQGRTLAHPDGLKQAILTRRSVRIFDGQRITDATMRELLDLTTLAPSSSNLQPWELHWVKSADKKSRLIEACLSQPAAKTSGELVVIVTRPDLWKRNTGLMIDLLNQMTPPPPSGVFTYYKKLVPASLMTGIGGAFVPFKWLLTRVGRYFRPMPQGPLGYADVRLWAHKSTALAAQTMMLSARAFDLDTCPMEGFDEWRVKSILGLPCKAEVSMVVAIGKSMPNGIYGPRLRFDKKLVQFEH
jgi:nitroreductase